MFAAQDKIPVFFEVATHFNRYPHMQLICVPLSLDEGTLAPMYFKVTRFSNIYSYLTKF